MEKIFLKNLKLDEEEVDGISFSIDKEKSSWTFSVMTLSDRSCQNFDKTDMGYKYQIVLYSNKKAEYFEKISPINKVELGRIVEENQ